MPHRIGSVIGSVATITIHTFTIVSILWLIPILSRALGDWPVFFYLMFSSWCLSLSIWTYPRLQGKSLDDNKDLQQYKKLKTYFLAAAFGLCMIWIMVFMGEPGNDDEGSFSANSVMAQLALDHFGYTSTFDNHTEFKFLSTTHSIVFYSLELLPLLILAVGGGMVHTMSEKIYTKAEHRIKPTKYEQNPFL